MALEVKTYEMGYGKDKREYQILFFPCKCSIDNAFKSPNLFHCPTHWKAKEDPPMDQMIEGCLLMGFIPPDTPDETRADAVASIGFPTQFRRRQVVHGRGRRLSDTPFPDQDVGDQGDREG